MTNHRDTNDGGGPNVGSGGLEIGADPGHRGRGLFRRRPAESAAGLGLFAAVYAALAEAGAPNGLALLVATVVAFLPGLVSSVVDALRTD